MSECTHNCETCGQKCSERTAPQYPERLIPIKHKLLVMSGKGGVGKSTVAAALSVALANAGFKVALLDVDFHGPSQPTLFHLNHKRLDGDENGIIPAQVDGIGLVSIGLMMEDENSAVALRGPAKMGLLKQIFEETNWGELDYLILDFPPGTGDEALSACQLIPGDKKAIMVTTPQEVSLADCRKCFDFCRQVNVPVLGVVENMSGFICPNCKTRHEIFSSGGGQLLADVYNVPLLANIPLDPTFLKECDEGKISDGLSTCADISAEIAKIVKAATDTQD